ncbi:hypothetical protein N7537_008426 [Penicillium hordei]|uniref:Uncharacterized protein n=1 Tax=Penicillium hordei TaxID=40994 RepID=A0AAD6E0G6_9EURO|nr:uncharacterized protein N7537_008426 [Penicillium hordei]KAJ5598342.1 hypothetical protein N7537_008426 [Penicillium hordei]
MPEADGQQHTQHKESLVERMFEHHHNHKQEDNSHSEKRDGVSKDAGKPKSYEDYLKKDDEALKRYYEEHKGLETEGQSYGGLK